MLFKFIVAVAVCGLAGAAGSLFTVSAIPGWYAGLVKPTANPPNWVFGPVWTALYFLMGVAAFLVWQKGFGRREVRAAPAAFGIQLVLNVAWSAIFFGMHSPLGAFIDIILLWSAILWTAIAFARISRPAMYLLLPYLAWVSFAVYLTFSIWILN